MLHLNYADPDANSAEFRSRIIRAYADFTTLQHSFLCAKHVLEAPIKGVFVECGVAAGAQVFAMAHAQETTGCLRDIHLYDSFDGIPFAGPEDDQQPGFSALIKDRNLPLADRLQSSGVAVCAQATLKTYIIHHGLTSINFVFHAGWFQDTLPAQCPTEPIALLRLDGDLYESTEVCLNALYHLVAPGGIVIIDDYGLTGCRKAVQEFIIRNKLAPTIQRVPNTPSANFVAFWEKS